MDTELLYWSAAICTLSVQPGICSIARRVLKLSTKLFCFSNKNIFALSELSRMKATSSEHGTPVGGRNQRNLTHLCREKEEDLKKAATANSICIWVVVVQILVCPRCMEFLARCCNVKTIPRFTIKLLNIKYLSFWTVEWVKTSKTKKSPWTIFWHFISLILPLEVTKTPNL